MDKRTIRAQKIPVAALVALILCEQLGVDEEEIKLEASLSEDLGCDSLDVIELIMAFEEEYAIEIPDNDIERVATVADVITYLEKREAKRYASNQS